MLRNTEVKGTFGDDDLTGGLRTTTYGLQGDDTLRGSAEYGEVTLIGGAGNDTYEIVAGSNVIINELGTTGDITDKIVATGLTSTKLTFGEIEDGDNDHLIVTDTETNTQFIILDWENTINIIESFEFADTTTTLAEFVTLVGTPTAVTWAQSGLIDAGYIETEITDADTGIIDVIATNNTAFESAANGATDILGDDEGGIHNTGDGADTVKGMGGDDSISLGGGDDWANGNWGHDTIDGGAGNDKIKGGKNKDDLTGGDGDDHVNGNKGFDVVHGGDGNDTVKGGMHDDYVYGDTGDDLVKGDLGNDNINGGAGNDTLTGGDGDDIFSFNSDDAGVNIITDFVSGEDLLRISDDVFKTVDLALEAFSDGTLTLSEGITVDLTGITSLSISDFEIV